MRQPNTLDNTAKKSMMTRIVTAIVLAAIVVPCLFLGGWFFIGLIIAALILVIHEFTYASSTSKRMLPVYVFIYFITFSFVFWIFIRNNMISNLENNISGFDVRHWNLTNGFVDIQFSPLAVAVTLFVLFFFHLSMKSFLITDVTYFFTMVLFIGIGFQSFLLLRFFPINAFGDSIYTPNQVQSSFLFVYVIIATIANDIGAYFVGVFFGRHKVNERISPKKTWEGFWGGAIISFIFSAGFGLVTAALGAPMLKFLNLDGWYWIVLLSAAMPFVANLGDFNMSAIKRHFNIKDFGTILKGHGGILDRIDSLLTVALTVAILIIFINNIIEYGNPFGNFPVLT